MRDAYYVKNPVAFLLAAHEVQTTFTGADLTFVDQVEARAAEEVLGHCVTTLVAPISHFIAGIPQEANIIVIDTASLGGLPATARQTLIQSLMDRTSPEGVHLILPSGRKMMPEAFASHYSEWTADSRRPDRRQKSRSLGVLFSRPPEVEPVIRPEGCRPGLPPQVGRGDRLSSLPKP